MATKRSKRSGTKAAAKRSSKTARPAARPKAAKPAAKAAAPPAARAAAPARREAASPVASPVERAVALRDAIQHSKLTAADPWGYTVKARAWQARVERLLERLGPGPATAESRKAVDALAAEVEGDRDFQEARRLF